MQYRQAVGGNGNGVQPNAQMRKNASSRSFQAFGFGASRTNNKEETSSVSNLPRRGSNINVNIAPTIIENDTPEIRKYKKRFNSDILCAALWGEYCVYKQSSDGSMAEDYI